MASPQLEKLFRDHPMPKIANPKLKKRLEKLFEGSRWVSELGCSIRSIAYNFHTRIGRVAGLLHKWLCQSGSPDRPQSVADRDLRG